MAFADAEGRPASDNKQLSVRRLAHGGCHAAADRAELLR